MFIGQEVEYPKYRKGNKDDYFKGILRSVNVKSKHEVIFTIECLGKFYGTILKRNEIRVPLPTIEDLKDSDIIIVIPKGEFNGTACYYWEYVNLEFNYEHDIHLITRNTNGLEVASK